MMQTTLGPITSGEFIINPPTRIRLLETLALKDFMPRKVDPYDADQIRIKIMSADHTGFPLLLQHIVERPKKQFTSRGCREPESVRSIHCIC
jgi:hypothetical protein